MSDVWPFWHVGPFDNDPCDDVSEWNWWPSSWKTIWTIPADWKVLIDGLNKELADSYYFAVGPKHTPCIK